MTTMRITIETDVDGNTTARTSEQVQAGAGSGRAEGTQATDGGGAPTLQAGGSSTGRQPGADSAAAPTDIGATNAGPPPDWLYKAISEAMAAAGVTGSSGAQNNPIVPQTTAYLNDGGSAPKNGH